MAVIYEKGQIVIPKYIRDMLKITSGSCVSVTVVENKIVIEPQSTFEHDFEFLTSQKRVKNEDEIALRMKKAKKNMHDEWSHVY
jgi:AbrB family looped-hinge helix DNA binding protein